jgi:steroid delta-isomerase-like uncharacterized protein
MSVQNKAKMRRGIEEVWNQGNYDVADEVIAQDFVAHMPGSTDDLNGPEGVKQYFAKLHQAFPDLKFTIEDHVAEGDRVIARWIARGTHDGDFRGIPPTGTHVAVTGITVNRFADGKIVEGWQYLDELGLLQQLGVAPG